MSASLGISFAIVCFLVYPQADTHRHTDPLMATQHEHAHIDARQNRSRAWESKQKTISFSAGVYLPSAPKINCCRSFIIPHSKTHYQKLEPAKSQSKAGQNCMQDRKSNSVLVISKLGTIADISLGHPSHSTNCDI